jgi:hypothetical protein
MRLALILVPIDRENYALSNCVLRFFLKVSGNGAKRYQS